MVPYSLQIRPEMNFAILSLTFKHYRISVQVLKVYFIDNVSSCCGNLEIIVMNKKQTKMVNIEIMLGRIHTLPIHDR